MRFRREKKAKAQPETAQPEEKAKSKGALDKQYFEEARSWDEDKTDRLQRSERKAWRVVGVVSAVAILEAVGLATLVPLKTVEPFVIRVDNNTGVTDVISNLVGTAGEVDEEAQDVLDKYWLGQYLRHREGYQWETRQYDRKLVGLLSSTPIQQKYAEYTDPRLNPSAPVAVYGRSAEVEVNVKAVSIIDSERVDGTTRKTALVRYTKQAKRAGETAPVTHWAATITYVYLNSPIGVEERQLNPLGFQVINYRNDQESVGG